jgi:hypothetical protein
MADAESTELTVVEDSLPTTLFGTNDPDQLIEIATAKAKALAKVVKAQKLSNKIGGREHVRVEGWELLGSLTGVFPVLEWSRPLENGWEARVEAKTRSGEIVGAAEAMCTRDEKTWSTRDEYALRSMAQTRATSKALRQPLGFIMVLAGYDPTPADEMTSDGLPDLPAPVSKILTREMVVQRIVDRAKEHDIQPEVLADVVDSAYQGKTIDDLTKDELVQLGTDIAAGKYDLPFLGGATIYDSAPPNKKPEQATEAARGTGAAPSGNPAPVTQPAEPSPLESPPADIQAVLDLTGGTLEQAVRAGETVAARRASAPAADGIAERVEKARKRAGVTA